MTPRRLLAEFTGTALLLAVVIGSGIMAERLSGGNVGLALLANTLATVWALYVLIEVFGPISGAHFNPVVSLMFWKLGHLNLKKMLGYWMCQFAGAIVGIWITHLPIFFMKSIERKRKNLSANIIPNCIPQMS